MLTRIKNILALGALSFGLFAFRPAPAAAQERTFEIANQSRYTIYHIYVSPSSYTKWGWDRLGDYVLKPQYQVTLSIYPDFYDVKLIDQDGDACIVRNVDFRSSDRWTVTNDDLLACELVTAF